MEEHVYKHYVLRIFDFGKKQRDLESKQLKACSLSHKISSQTSRYVNIWVFI